MQVSGDKAAEESSRNSTSSTNQQFSSSAAVSLHNTAVVQSAVKSALLWFSDETHYCFVALHWVDALLLHQRILFWSLNAPQLSSCPTQSSGTEYPSSKNLTEYPSSKMGDILQNTLAQQMGNFLQNILLKNWEISYRIFCSKDPGFPSCTGCFLSLGLPLKYQSTEKLI